MGPAAGPRKHSCGGGKSGLPWDPRLKNSFAHLTGLDLPSFIL